MDDKKVKKLKSKGWAVGNAGDFLDLSPAEVRFIELKLALSASLREERKKQEVTQVQLAEILGSSQSRVAKMESGDPSVSIDLLLKALLSLGVSNRAISKIIA